MPKLPKLRLSICIAAAVIIAALLAFSLIISDTDPVRELSINSNTAICIDAEETSLFISADERSSLLIERHPARNMQVDESGEEIHITTGGRGILEVSIPSWIRIEDLRITTTSGDVAVEDILSSKISISSESGSMMVTGTSAPSIRAESSSGNIILTDTSSESTSLQNSSGFIRGIGILGDIEAKTKSGNIYIVPIGEGNVNAEADSGDISVIAGERSISWDTEIGKVTIFGEMQPTQSDNRDATVTAQTKSGDITISK